MIFDLLPIKILKELSFLCTIDSETNSDANMWYKMKMAQAGNSGWSFGPIQFDISVSPFGRILLEEIGIDKELIETLRFDTFKNMVVDRKLINSCVSACNIFLMKNTETIYAFSKRYIDDCVDRIINLDGLENLKIDPISFLFLVDYHNQFYISQNGACHNWLKTLDKINHEMIIEFRHNMNWYKNVKGKIDIERRERSILNFCRKMELINKHNDDMPEWAKLYGMGD